MLRSADAFAGIVPDRITIGDSAILVELARRPDADGTASETETNGAGRPLAGIAHRPPGADARSVSSNVDLNELVAPLDRAENPPESDEEQLERAVAIATLNAVSAPCMEWEDGDPMALLEPSVDRITMVGLFRPAIRKFDGVEVRVIERAAVESVPDPDDVTVSLFGPADTEAAMAGADVVFVTGSAFVYGGATRYIEAAPDTATVVVVGATASFLPEPLFERGVDVLAGAAVDEPDRARGAVRDGACGTGLHEAGVRKGYVASESDGLAL
ncbi:Rossmann-like domain-containing protein [Natrialbaceae archaeon A-arb3/5]